MRCTLARAVICAALLASCGDLPHDNPYDVQTPRGALAGEVRLSGLAVHAGALVSVSGPISATTLSDPTGTFAFSGLPAGTYRISARKDPDWLPMDVPGVVVHAGATAAVPDSPIVLSPVATASLRGTVLLERPAGDASGTTVIVTGHDFRGIALSTRSTITGADGNWTIEGLPGGSYQVAYAHDRHDAAAPMLLSLGPGEAQALPTETLRVARGAIAGAVTLSAGGVGDGFSVGTDLSGIEVSLTGLPDGVHVAHAFTDAAGRYQLDDVPVSLSTPAGAYGLSASRANFHQPQPTSVTVQGDATTAAPAITLEVDTGLLQGTVVVEDYADDPGAEPTVADILVSVTGIAFNGAPSTRSPSIHSSGVFTIDQLPPGIYDITVTSKERTCDRFERALVTAGATWTATAATDTPDRVRCVDAVAPTAVVLGTPVPDPTVFDATALAPQPGYTPIAQVVVPIVTQATDDTSNLHGYEVAMGADPDWKTAQLTPGTPASLSLTVGDPAASHADDTVVIWVRAKDWAGNRGPSARVQVVYDNRPPSAPTVSTPRDQVNATSAAMTLTGGDDPNFLRYEACAVEGPSCPFAPTPASFVVSIPANRGVAVYARAVDRAGNVSATAQGGVGSDLDPPLPPQMAPSYDPYHFAVRSPTADFFVARGGRDGGPSADGTADWIGVAWMEVDDGSGFTPLCDAPSCRGVNSWEPCRAGCDCFYSRRICAGETFVGVRVPLSSVSSSTTVSFRSVDFAGNVGASTSQQVFTEVAPSVVAYSPRVLDHPILREQLLGYEDGDEGWLLDLGANRRPDATDARCLLSPSRPSQLHVTPLARDVVAYGLSLSGVTTTDRLYVRTPADDGTFCKSWAVDTEVAAAARLAFVAGDRGHVVWAEDTGAGWRVMMRQAPAGARVTDGEDQLVELPSVGEHPELPAVAGVWMGGATVLVKKCATADELDGAKCEWLAITPDASGSYAAPQALRLSIPAWGDEFTLSKDGSALAYRSSIHLNYVRQAGTDGVFDDTDRLRGLVAPELGGAPLVIDGQHMAVMDWDAYTGAVALWDIGYDGRWASGDELTTTGFATSLSHRHPDLDQGLLAYSLGSSLEIADLSTLRWEAPLLSGFDPNGDGLVSNGVDAIVWRSGTTDDLWSRTAAGTMTRVHQPGVAMSAEGSSLIVAERGGSPALQLYTADDSGRYFADPTPVTVWGVAAWAVRIGGGKVILYESSSTSPTGTRCWILEPAGNPLATVTTTGTLLEVLPDAFAGGLGLGVNARQAVFACPRTLCVLDAGADQRFGSEDLGGMATLRLPAGFTAPGPWDPFELSGTRMILSTAQGIVLLDAGADGLFDTFDDRARLLSPRRRIASHDVAVAGDWAAWIDPGASGVQQVFALHGFDGAPRQLTTTASVKSSVTVDARGRVHWVDSAVNPRAIMTWEP